MIFFLIYDSKWVPEQIQDGFFIKIWLFCRLDQLLLLILLDWPFELINILKNQASIAKFAKLFSGTCTETSSPTTSSWTPTATSGWPTSGPASASPRTAPCRATWQWARRTTSRQRYWGWAMALARAGHFEIFQLNPLVPDAHYGERTILFTNSTIRS